MSPTPFGWRAVFLLYGLAAAVLAAAFWRVPRPAVAPRPAGPLRPAAFVATYRRLLGDPAARLVLGATFVEAGCFFGGFVYVGASLHDRFDLPYAAIGAILAGFGVGGLLYGRSVRRLLPRLGERGMVLLGGGVVGACFLALALLPSWVPAIPLVVLLGLGFFLLHGTLQTRATELAPEARGAAVALFAFAVAGGQAVGAAIIGRLVDAAGYAPAFAVAGTAVALLDGAFATHARRARPTEPSLSLDPPRGPGSGSDAGVEGWRTAHPDAARSGRRRRSGQWTSQLRREA